MRLKYLNPFDISQRQEPSGFKAFLYPPTDQPSLTLIHRYAVLEPVALSIELTGAADPDYGDF